MSYERTHNVLQDEDEQRTIKPVDRKTWVRTKLRIEVSENNSGTLSNEGRIELLKEQHYYVKNGP